MKKNTVLVILLSMLIFSLMQSCEPTEPKPVKPDKKVTIKIKSIIQNGEYHLDMKDSKGGSDIDDLETVFIKRSGEPGTIIWKDRFFSSKIRSIESIYSKETDTEIFKLGTTKINKKNIKLELPLDIPSSGTELIERYYIKYIPKDKDTVITIDPYIRIID